jgi:hypothetical protein
MSKRGPAAPGRGARRRRPARRRVRGRARPRCSGAGRPGGSGDEARAGFGLTIPSGSAPVGAVQGQWADRPQPVPNRWSRLGAWPAVPARSGRRALLGACTAGSNHAPGPWSGFGQPGLLHARDGTCVTPEAADDPGIASDRALEPWSGSRVTAVSAGTAPPSETASRRVTGRAVRRACLFARRYGGISGRPRQSIRLQSIRRPSEMAAARAGDVGSKAPGTDPSAGSGMVAGRRTKSPAQERATAGHRWPPAATSGHRRNWVATPARARDRE